MPSLKTSNVDKQVLHAFDDSIATMLSVKHSQRNAHELVAAVTNVVKRIREDIFNDSICCDGDTNDTLHVSKSLQSRTAYASVILPARVSFQIILARATTKLCVIAQKGKCSTGCFCDLPTPPPPLPWALLFHEQGRL